MPGSRWVPHLRRCQPNCRGTAGSGEALAPPPSLLACLPGRPRRAVPPLVPRVYLAASGRASERTSARSSLLKRHLSRAVAHFLPPPSLTPRAPSPPLPLRKPAAAAVQAHSYGSDALGRAGGWRALGVGTVPRRGRSNAVALRPLPFDLVLQKAQSDNSDRTNNLKKQSD